MTATKDTATKDFEVLEVKPFMNYDSSEMCLVRISGFSRSWRLAYYLPEVGDQLQSLLTADMMFASPAEAEKWHEAGE